MRKYWVITAVFIFLMGQCVFAGAGVGAEKKTYSLSLDEVTRIALLNSFDIQLTKYDAWIARTDENEARSIYDTILEADVEYRNDQSKRATTFTGTKVMDNNYNVGVSKKLPTGTTVSIDMTNKRQSTDSVFSSAPLTHDSTLGVTVEQDLGKNLFGIQDRGDVKITLTDIESAEYTSLTKIEESVAEVQKAYWDLVLQIEKVGIEEAMVAEAKRFYDLYQERLKDGLAEIPDVIAAEANYKTRKNTLLLARNRVQARASDLRLLANIEDDINIKPTESFSLPDGNEELLKSLGAAFENRRDYKKVHNEIKSKDIKLSMEKNNMWPEINLTATLERNGLGDHFKQAVTQITTEDNPNFFAGLTITFPLENRKAKGRLKAAELEKAKALLELKFLERKIAIDIADQVRDCNVFKELAINSQEIAKLQAQKLEEEIKRFSYGRSNTDILIRFQEDLVLAQSIVVEATRRYHGALVDLRKKEGTLLNKYWEGEL